MSLLWAYDARKCDGEFCMEDCDHCYKAEIEADGFITRKHDLYEPPEEHDRAWLKKNDN